MFFVHFILGDQTYQMIKKNMDIESSVCSVC